MRLSYMKTHVFGAAATMDNLITLSEQFWDEIREHPIEFSGTTASRPGRAHPACARRNLRRTTGHASVARWRQYIASSVTFIAQTGGKLCKITLLYSPPVTIRRSRRALSLPVALPHRQRRCLRLGPR